LLNILVGRIMGRIVARITDFGCVFNPASEPLPHSGFQKGFYGSLFCTAPELFGTVNFAGDWFKVDVYALGVLLYTKHFGHLPDWTKYPLKYQTTVQKEPVSGEDRETLTNAIKTAIDDKIDTFPQNTQEEKFLYLIYSMLQRDPAKRPTIQEVL